MDISIISSSGFVKTQYNVYNYKFILDKHRNGCYIASLPKIGKNKMTKKQAVALIGYLNWLNTGGTLKDFVKMKDLFSALKYIKKIAQIDNIFDIQDEND